MDFSLQKVRTVPSRRWASPTFPLPWVESLFPRAYVSLLVFSTVWYGPHPQAIFRNMQKSAPLFSLPPHSCLRNTWLPQLQSLSGVPQLKSACSSQPSPPQALSRKKSHFLSSRSSQFPTCGWHPLSAVMLLIFCPSWLILECDF